MATRMTDTDQTTMVDRERPRVWPWILLAAIVAVVLLWSAAANRGVNESPTTGTTTPYNMAPSGTGTTGGITSPGTPGTGDVGGVGTPSPAPTYPAPAGAP